MIDESSGSDRRFPLDLILVFLLALANLPSEQELEFGKMLGDLSQTGPGWAAFFDKSLVDNPIGAVQAAVATAALIIWALATFRVLGGAPTTNRRLRWALLLVLLVTFVALPTMAEIKLAHEVGARGHAHDGGVVQTMEAARFLLRGENPYAADYRPTPMATLDWGPGNPAIIHHPYMPLSFLLHVPGMLLAGDGYDTRYLYLVAFLLPLLLLRRWTACPERALVLATAWSLSPFLARHIVEGRNDVVVLVLLVVSLDLFRRDHVRAGAIVFGLACATKQFAFLFVPFLAIALGRPGEGWRNTLSSGARALAPAAIPIGLLVLPFVLWNAGAFWDDTVSFNAGTSEVSYPIGGTPGYGIANVVNALGLAESRYHYFPFVIVQILFLPPLLWALLRWQREDRSFGRAATAFSIFLFAFLFLSRIFHHNYFGLIFFFLVVGAAADALHTGRPEREPAD